MTELWPETAFELPSEPLPAGSFHNNIIKTYHIILVLILTVGNLKKLWHITFTAKR